MFIEKEELSEKLIDDDDVFFYSSPPCQGPSKSNRNGKKLIDDDDVFFYSSPPCQGFSKSNHNGKKDLYRDDCEKDVENNGSSSSVIIVHISEPAVASKSLLLSKCCKFLGWFVLGIVYLAFVGRLLLDSCGDFDFDSEIAEFSLPTMHEVSSFMNTLYYDQDGDFMLHHSEDNKNDIQMVATYKDIMELANGIDDFQKYLDIVSESDEREAEELVPYGEQTTPAPRVWSEVQELRMTESNGADMTYYSFELTADNFDSWLSQHSMAFVNFNAHWCPWSQQLMPTWDEFARTTMENNNDSNQQEGDDTNVGIAHINCFGLGMELCSDFNIRVFPSLRLFHQGQAVTDYHGDRTVESLQSFVQYPWESPVQVVSYVAVY